MDSLKRTSETTAARAAGSRSGRASRGLIALLFVAGVVHQACAPGPDSSALPAGEVLTEALAAVGPAVVEPALEDFMAEMDALEGAIAGWQAAPEDGAARAAVQDAWLAAMERWQRLELMQIGPAGSSLSVIGGEDLRDEIYSWPTVNACRIDQETVERAWGDEDYFTVNLVNSYGLDAIERLAFGGEDNDCAAQVDINEEGSWAALSSEDIARQRADFAAALAAEVSRQGEGLLDDWRGRLSAALPAGTDPYESQQEALNAVYDALFYLELTTEDRKLAQPLGIKDCSSDTCPEAVECLESGASVAAIAANLDGFRALFTGGDGAGLDDVLEALGHGDLSEQIVADLDAASAAAAALSGPLDEALETDRLGVEALYEAVKAVTDALQGDLATVLSVQIPSEAAGDND
jgi:predicted lipoprotein